MHNDAKRKTLTDILALSKSMKGAAMAKKYAPAEPEPEAVVPAVPVEGSPEEEGQETPAMEAKEDGPGAAEPAKAMLLELQADPEKLKALLAKLKK